MTLPSTSIIVRYVKKTKLFNASTNFNLIKPNFAFHTVSMDLIGPLPMGIAGTKYIIVVIDHLTK